MKIKRLTLSARLWLFADWLRFPLEWFWSSFMTRLFSLFCSSSETARAEGLSGEEKELSSIQRKRTFFSPADWISGAGRERKSSERQEGFKISEMLSLPMRAAVVWCSPELFSLEKNWVQSLEENWSKLEREGGRRESLLMKSLREGLMFLGSIGGLELSAGTQSSSRERVIEKERVWKFLRW